jgi:hypothetical protein
VSEIFANLYQTAWRHTCFVDYVRMLPVSGLFSMRRYRFSHVTRMQVKIGT